MKAYNGITIREILQKRTGWETWSLYEIYAAEFNEAAARFYLDFHCRLTEHPVSLHPVWPLFIEGNYVIKHNQNNMYMLVEGNVSAVKTFPSVALRQLSHNSSQTRLYEVSCAGRQQLISAGRTRALQYTYLWREPLDQMGIVPKYRLLTLQALTLLLVKRMSYPTVKRCVSNHHLTENLLFPTKAILWISEK